MIRSASVFVSGVIATLALAACSKEGGKDGADKQATPAPGLVAAPPGPPGPAQQDGAAGLVAVFEAAAAACNAKEFQQGKALTLSLIPGPAQLKKVLKPEVEVDVFEDIVGFYGELPPSDERAACLLVPGDGRTEIRAHASSVEELIAYKEGTVAFAEFPGGANQVATQLLAPGTTFYEVEVTEPGKDAGTKFHLFFWDGAQWRMLGPVWRVLRS